MTSESEGGGNERRWRGGDENIFPVLEVPRQCRVVLLAFLWQMKYTCSGSELSKMEQCLPLF